MGIKNQLFDQELKKSFSDFEVAPAPGVWDSIASQLAAKEKTRRVIPIWLRIAAGLAILLGTSITAWLVMNPVREADGEFSDANTQKGDEALIDDPAREDFSNLQQIQEEQADFQPSLTFASIDATQEKKEEEDFEPWEKLETKPNLPSKLGFISHRVFIAPITQMPILGQSLNNLKEEAISTTLLASVASTKEPVDEFSLGIRFSPQFSFRVVENSFSSSNPFNELESPLLTFSAGAFARFKVFEKLSVQIGLDYSVIGQFIDNISSVQQRPHFPSFEVSPYTGTGHPQTLLTSFGIINFSTENLVFADLKGERIKSSFDFFTSNNLKRMRKADLGLSQLLTFIDVPILLNLRLFKFGNTSLTVTGGGGIGYLVQNQVFLGRHLFSSSIGETQGLRNLSFFASGGFAFDYKLNDFLRFSIEPNFQQYFRSFFEKSPSFAPARPFKYSINTGVIIDF